MLVSTTDKLRCHCGGNLDLRPGATEGDDVRSGELACQSCAARYLIMAGVALLVEDTLAYLLGHVKGISKIVPEDEIPSEFRDDFRDARLELEEAGLEHIEEDLEAERVNALYVMNHYLRARDWWPPSSGKPDPLLDDLIRKHWDHGPFERIGTWAANLAATKPLGSAVELGCGVGGLARVVGPHCGFYLGVDFSFASIALARHLALGTPYPQPIRIPNDLLQGQVSREIHIPTTPAARPAGIDFVVADLQRAPLATGEWDLALSLNAIDMLDEPQALPELQRALLREGGVAIQSCPYIWHEGVARELRARLPSSVTDSARAVEWLYRQSGFRLTEVVEHQPWLFFKNLRQLEIYSVHMFAAASEHSK